MKFVVGGVLAAVFAILPAGAQSVISARSGTVHHVEGRVLLADELVQPKFGHFPDLKDGEELRTEDGRAEILLTPGVFLRVASNSAVRMISNRLSDTRVELLQGEALVECAEILKDNAVTVVYKDSAVSLAKKGLYNFTTAPAELRVFKGEALVRTPSGDMTARKGKQVPLDGVLVASKFNTKQADGLFDWSQNRSGYLAMANYSAARSLVDDGSPWRTSGWLWNPGYGMFTYMPSSGYFYSPFGYLFASPYTVYTVYPTYPSRGGTGVSGSTGSGAGRRTPSPGLGRNTGSGSGLGSGRATTSVSSSAGGRSSSRSK
jgi:hypothetical protein